MTTTAERVNSRRLIEGPSDKLMAISPLKHAWARDILQVMENNTWFTKDVDLSRDVKQYKQGVLTPREKEAYDGALAFLSNLDGFQLHNITDNIAKHVTSPEVKMCLVRQAWEEALHVEAYSTLAEAICADPMEVYMRFERDGVLAAKNEHVLRQNAILDQTYSPRTFALSTVTNVALEGIYFFSGFLIFYTLAKNGKMLGSADMIAYIQRDEEGTHLELFKHMLQTLQVENPEIFDAGFYEDARELLRGAVELETTWGKHLIGGGILGLTDPIMEGFVQWRANECCAQLGFEPLYPGVKNPVPWFQDISRVNGRKKNFFESKVTDYSVGGALEWE
ncbi:ribonucleotide-diphosphate reductase subunit beta [Ralstonia pickettii]|uniref:Ribonucleoside-diphosphate reductase subunit beta n=1 Tax=Ralstonia pickettii TaxID=329 RepID=A0A2N4TXT9_RALPI|nr:ribonucleotide-diphosphate reductase subunit beta [Ralstonia pickettii]PLC44498.1 ribonucleotide-diphosphate reductase subunit beta [Ralstonia pickettii]